MKQPFSSSPQRISTVAMLVAACCLLMQSAVLAEVTPDRWSYCSTQFIPEDLLMPLPGTTTGTPKDDIDVKANKAQLEKGKIFNFEGNVFLQRSNQILRADKAIYYQEQEQIHAQGSIRLQTEKQVLIGDEAQVDVKNDTAQITHPEFWLLENHLRGKALSVNVLDRNFMELKQVEFTSCDKQNEDWVLRASTLTLDHEKNEGVAHHARIEFMHVPFIYLPYLSFPLSGRKTGFLVPSVGDSTVSGTEIAVPYYINIAPNRDATITPRYFEKRGVQYIGEYRYLHEKSLGQAELEYLPDDDLAKKNRIYAAYSHQGKPADGWTTNAVYRYASDADYFDEFANNLSSSSITHLERHLDVNYQANYWSVKSSIQYFQTLDETIPASQIPYQRRPQLQLLVDPFELGSGFEFSANAEYVNFHRSVGVKGIRTDLVPQVSWPYRESAGFFQPMLKMRYTSYDLQDQDPAFNSETIRTLPQFSIDSGLFFERNVTFQKQGMQQTLEPRLFYLYVPYRNQNDLIVDENGNSMTFDSSLPQFSFAELFRDNRFSGADRVGDANQLSASLTTRFLTDTGAEWLSASIGQIVYFQDRDVVLPNGVPETDRQSDIAAELRSTWNRHLDSKASLLWDKAENQVYRGSLQFRYMFDRDKITNLSYRYEREQINQLDISVLWRLQHRWKAVWRWYYSYLDSLKLETAAGLEYESCCWAIRIVHRDYIRDLELDDETRNETIWLQLELKGMASVGSKVDSAFETGLFAD